MREHARLLLLIVIMAAVAAIIGASAIQIIYEGGLDRERDRLQDIVQAQARLLESIARFDQAYSTYPEGAGEGSLKQFLDVHARFSRRAMGQTGELALARREGGEMVFLLRQSRHHADAPMSVPMASELAAPMRAALNGQSGAMIGRDYAGALVLAAHEPVALLNLGLVAKIDIAEIRQRFTQAVLPLVGIGVVAVLAAATLFFQVTEPVLKRMRRNEARFRGLFDHMKSGAAVFEPAPDGGFVFTDLNRRGEEIGRLDRGDVVGKSVAAAFPGADEFGLLRCLEAVHASGTACDIPARHYRDERIEGWRDAHLYKLPSGELVVLFNDVSEQKVAEQALRESEARFRGTFDNAAVGMAHVGMDGSWLLVNNRLCEIVGYSRAELMCKTFQDVTYPDDLQSDLDLFKRLMRGEIATYTLEKRYVHRDGHVVWVNLTTAVQRDEAGAPLYCISGRRGHQPTQASPSRRCRRTRTACAPSSTPAATRSCWSRPRDGCWPSTRPPSGGWSSRLASVAPVGADLDQLLPPDLARERLAVVREVATSGNPAHMDLPIRAGWFEFWFYPVCHAGQPITEVAIFARDITERKRAEAELRRLYQAIQQSPSSVVITNPDGRIVYVNPKFCDVTGYSYDEAIGQNPRILKSGYTNPDEYKALWKTISAGRVWQGEFHNRKKNGELYWEIASIAPVKNDAGDIINFVAVKEDVTERRAIEEQFRQSQKMQAIGQLTGGIAHDFNNLLTIILGNLQLLQRTEDAEQAPRLISDALWAAQRGGELTHRLLAFARMQPLRPSLINLNGIVRGLTGLLARTLGPNVEVVEALDPALPQVLADAGELERAIVNLAINARDAMPSGGRLLLQTARAVLDEDYVEHHPDVSAGDYVMLAVSDSGAGIPPEMLTRIFEPFFTTKPVGRGSGLGLSMVYGFLKQSGGHASVYSEVGTGTTFKLFFPEAARCGAAAPRPMPAQDVEFSAHGLTALVVEDEERLRLVAASLLKELGFSVFEAGDGPEALRQAEAATSLDLLFTDVELPGGMNGIAVAEGVRRRHPGVRVLCTTGYSAALTPGNGHVPENAAVLVKPYARQQLIHHLRALFPPAPSGGREGA